MPPQPTASASAAAIRPRHGKAAAASDLRETSLSKAIVDVLNPGLLTAGSIANNTGFQTCSRTDAIAAPSERPYPAGAATSPTTYKKQGGNAMPSSRTISANGIELFVREQGQGPLVLLCHGW